MRFIRAHSGLMYTIFEQKVSQFCTGICAIPSSRRNLGRRASDVGSLRRKANTGNIKGTVQAAVVRALMSHQAQAEHLLNQDQQALGPFTAPVYELLKAGKNIDLSDIGRPG